MAEITQVSIVLATDGVDLDFQVISSVPDEQNLLNVMAGLVGAALPTLVAQAQEVLAGGKKPAALALAAPAPKLVGSDGKILESSDGSGN